MYFKYTNDINAVGMQLEQRFIFILLLIVTCMFVVLMLSCVSVSEVDIVASQ